MAADLAWSIVVSGLRGTTLKCIGTLRYKQTEELLLLSITFS